MKNRLFENLTLVERFNLRSGPIHNIHDNSLKSGVVFTNNDDASPDDFGTAGPASLVGKILLNTNVKDKLPLEDREFTILGGYLASQKAGGVVEISNLFGAALAPPFSLNVGNNMIGDNWRLIEDAKFLDKDQLKHVDERNLGGSGWTFIVDNRNPLTPKEERKFYPHSSDEIHIFDECPEIEITAHSLNQIKQGVIQVEATVEVSKGTVGDLTWDFGDGSAPVTAAGLTATHDYTQEIGDGDPTKYTITVSYDSNDGCKDTATREVSIGRMPHPSLSKVYETGRKDTADGKSVVVAFKAELTDPNNPHETYTWNFGDGSKEKVSKGLEESHTYAYKDDVYKPIVTVDGKGPKTCASNVSTNISIAPPCPVIGQVKQINKVNLNGGEQTQFKLKAEFTGAPPKKFIWTWDKNKRVETTIPEVDIVLPRTKQDARPVIITLNTEGPGDCTGKSDICVHVPAIETADCPWYMKAFPFAIALFMTLLISAVITCYIGISMDRVIEGTTDHLYTWTIVMAFLTIITGFAWPFVGRKINCPPQNCAVLSIGWVSMFGAAAFTAMIQTCLPNFWILFVVFVLLAAGFRYLYQKNCRGKMELVHEMLFLLMGVIGFFVAYFMHAKPCLDCLG